LSRLVIVVAKDEDAHGVGYQNGAPARCPSYGTFGMVDTVTYWQILLRMAFRTLSGIASFAIRDATAQEMGRLPV